MASQYEYELKSPIKTEGLDSPPIFRVVEGTRPRPLAPEDRFLSGRRLVLVFLGFFTAVLLVSLDQTIVATALPRIVSDFNALADVTWVVTAYFLTQGGCVLVVGQILKLSRKKIVFLVAISLFELGSLICAVSKSMPVLIFGRAVAGCGAAGIQISVSTIIPEITPLEKRPILFASFGAVIGLSAVAGPLLGGVFTDKVSWQWCFWINLPLGAVAVALVSFLLPNHPATESFDGHRNGTSRIFASWMRLDWVGAVLILGFFTTLLLPLQWGGNTKPWNNPTVIALFVVAAVLLVCFLFWERHKGEGAMIPLEVLTRKTQLGCALSGFLGYLNLFLSTYYLPLWYQARGHSATRSGIDILPLLIAVVGAAGVAGAVITKTGRYWWFLFICPFSTSIGAGLLYTMRAESPVAHSIGFQILFGIGIGAVFQNVLIAVQADYADNEAMIPQATSFVSFCQMLGGIVGVAMAGSIFANELRQNLVKYAPDLPVEAKDAILQSVTVIKLLAPSLQSQVIEAYARSLDVVFLVGVPAGVLTSLAALMIANHSLKKGASSAVHV